MFSIRAALGVMFATFIGIAPTPMSEPAATAGGSGAASEFIVAPTLLFGCARCEDGENQHTFQGNGAYMDCDAFNMCHNDWQAGWCTEWHWGCQTSPDEMVSGATASVLPEESMADVARNYEPARVRKHLMDHSGFAYYNADRRVIQRIGCGGAIVAQYPVSPAVAQALQ